MNYENLHKLIDRYEENIYYLNDSHNDEKFKWHAVQRFQDVWFSPEAESLDFSELFYRAIKGSTVLINNSTVQPANGVVKLAEKAPEEVERLFREVLFADDDDDLNLRQEHIEEFLEGMEVLLQQYYGEETSLPRTPGFLDLPDPAVEENRMRCHGSPSSPDSSGTRFLRDGFALPPTTLPLGKCREG